MGMHVTENPAIRSGRETAPRKLFVLSGKRGGFGAMVPMMRCIEEDPDLELQLVLTDQHLSEQFGKTIAEVERYFKVAATVDMEQNGSEGAERSKAIARCMYKMTDVLDELAPDICLVYGDRGEAMATALAATNLGIPIAHIQGGDLSGSVDDQIRHAITKLAHLHFASTEQSGERIRRMGEDAWRVHVVGDNHVDTIVNGEFADAGTVASELGIDLTQPVVIVLQHSETTEPEKAYDQMSATLRAVRTAGRQAVVIYPCSDVGYEGILKAIDQYAVGDSFVVRKNLDAHLFLGLMNVAGVLVGNSSAGIIEARYFGLPSVNIGRRQLGRERGATVISVDHSEREILEAINKSLSDEVFRRTIETSPKIYGDGFAGKRIVSIIKETELGDGLWKKRMAY